MLLVPCIGFEHPAPRAIFGNTKYTTYDMNFYRAILMLDKNLTLLQFFGHISLNNGPISKIQKLADS